MNVTFDIETIPLQNEALRADLLADHLATLPDLLAAVKAPGNYKDPVKIEEYCAAERSKIELGHAGAFEDFFLKTSFDGGLGQICCIGFAVDDEPAISRYVSDASAESETAMLRDFFAEVGNWNRALSRPVVIGHNSNAFDIPFVWKRCIVLGIKPPPWFPRDPKPWSDNTFDTMIAWNGIGAKAGGSMERICKILGIPGKDGMGGADVWPAFQAGKFSEIETYCRGDVERTRAMYRRMTFSTSS